MDTPPKEIPDVNKPTGNPPAAGNGASQQSPTPPPDLSVDSKASLTNHQPPANNGATRTVKRTLRDTIRMGIKAYSASLLTVGVMMPVVASFIAVGLYLTLLNSPLPPFLIIQPSSQWYTFVYSTFLTG